VEAYQPSIIFHKPKQKRPTPQKSNMLVVRPDAKGQLKPPHIERYQNVAKLKLERRLIRYLAGEFFTFLATYIFVESARYS
jgi:hypothetical protein